MESIGLINSGKVQKENQILKEAVKTAVTNKCTKGSGLIMDRKSFQPPNDEGVKILRSIQKVYLKPEINIA
jgi:class I fructose-bisphosphate aldolase